MRKLLCLLSLFALPLWAAPPVVPVALTPFTRNLIATNYDNAQFRAAANLDSARGDLLIRSVVYTADATTNGDLAIQYSWDATNWYNLLADGAAVWTNNLYERFNEPSIMWNATDKHFYVVSTRSVVAFGLTNSPYVGIIKSPDLIHWKAAGVNNDGLLSVLATNGQAWSPEWYQEAGSNWVLFSIQGLTCNTMGAIHSDGYLTNWSALQSIVLPTFDICGNLEYFLVKATNKWWLFANDDLYTLLYTNSTAILGTYVLDRDLTITGAGGNDAGASVVWHNGAWHLFFQNVTAGWHSRSSSLYNWTLANTTRVLERTASTFNNGTVLVATGDMRGIVLSAIANQENTNAYVAGVLKADAVKANLLNTSYSTNAALGGATVNLSVARQYTNVTSWGTLALTGISGDDLTRASSTTLVISCASNKVVTVPASWRVTQPDAGRSWTINPTTNLVITIDYYPGISTNAQIRMVY